MKGDEISEFKGLKFKELRTHGGIQYISSNVCCFLQSTCLRLAC